MDSPQEQLTQPFGWNVPSDKESNPNRRIVSVTIQLDAEYAHEFLDLYDSQFDEAHPRFGRSPIKERFKGRYIGRILETAIDKLVRLKNKRPAELPPPAAADASTAKERDRKKQLWLGIIVGLVVLGIIGGIVAWWRNREE